MQSKPCLALRRPLILIAVLACASSLAACETAPRSASILIPQSFREPCKGATSPMNTQADIDVFMVRQEAALQTCEAKRLGVVELVDKAQVKPKRWWDFRAPDS